MDAFYAILQETLTIQRGWIGAKRIAVTELEQARITLCKAMFANLGMLIWKYHENTIVIDQFFQLELVRRKQQSFFTGSLNRDKFIWLLNEHSMPATR